MSRPNLILAAAVTASGLFASVHPASAQSIEGAVVVAGWEEPVPGAEVRLMDAERGMLATTTTDEDGGFAFRGLEPGYYHLQGRQGETVSEILGAIELRAGHSRTGIRVTMPSVLFERAQACFTRAGRDRRSGVLAGFAYDPDTDMPLPGSRVVVHWREDGEPHQTEARSDAGGRYVFCDVPVETELRVTVQALGRMSDTGERVALRRASIARFDIPVELELARPVRVVEESRQEGSPTNLATLVGTLLDAESGRPIATASVELGATGQQVLTDERGRFRFSGVSPGTYQFQVTRIGYDWDWESGVVEVEPSANILLELHAAPRAVELEAIVVRASTPETRMARGNSVSTRILSPDRIREAEERTQGMGDLIRELPSLQIRQGRFETYDGIEYGYCVESSRALARMAPPEQESRLPWCEMIAVIIDGIETIRGGEALHMVRVHEIESVEFLPPIGAMRYGERAAANGALLIWTRGRGPHRETADRDGS